MFKILSCRRSPKPPVCKPHREWQGYFDFELSDQPAAVWRDIALGLSTDMLNDWPDFTGRVVTVRCSPERLQFLAEQMAKWIEQTSTYYEDFKAHPERLTEFEKQLDQAVERLVL
jgi:hypothetical protein